jgi:gas vesicle protein
MKEWNRIRSFCLGLGAGAVVATLFAPKSGANTRAYCQTKTRETADLLRRRAEELRKRAVKTVEEGFQHQVSRFSAAVDAGRSAYKKAS